MGTQKRLRPGRERDWNSRRLRAKAQGRVEPVDSTGPRIGFFRRSLLWTFGLAAAAAATLVTSWLVGIPAQLVDPSAAKDTLRSGSEISISAEITQLDDQGLSTVVPGRFQLSTRSQQIIGQSMGAVSREFLEEIRSAGGVSLESLTLRLIVEGRRNQEIRILDIRPEIVDRKPPIDGTLFDIPSQGGQATLKMLVNLDRLQPVVSEVIVKDDNELAEGTAFFGNRTISLRDREEQVIILRAVATKHYAAFNLIVDYQIGNQTKAMTVTDQGRPFRVTGWHNGGGPDLLSYQEAFELQGDFSMCRVADARHMSSRSGIRCG